MAKFIHLRAHSAYSLLKGAIKIPDLITLTKNDKMPALALTDHDNLFGSLEFSEYAVKAGIQPIIGLTVSLVPYASESGNNHQRQLPDQLLIYAANEQGYLNLLKLASAQHVSPAQGTAPLIEYATLAKHSDGLIALTGGIHGGFGKLLLNNRAADAEKLLKHLHEVFGDRLYIEIQRHQVAAEKQIERAQIDAALTHNIPLVATNSIYFATSDMYEAHDALVCIAEGRYVTETDRPRYTPNHRFKTAEEMALLFRDLPEAIANTRHIAQRCSVWAPSRSPILPGFHVTDDAGVVLSESEALRVKAHAGLRDRLKRHVFTAEMDEAAREAAAKPYIDRLDFELDVIITMKFPGYFLIVSDFITWAKAQGIPVGPGRGSGAGSVVAWVLLITDLDPLRYGLIFERFLNPERVSMPDFDIDFCQERREEVIRYVREKYGDDRVAQIITFGKLQARAVLRDVGRVLQMPYSQVDRICKLVPNNPAAPVTLQEAISQEPLMKQAIDDEMVAKLVALSLKLEGLYRHASTHAAGVVIGDRPLVDLTPLYCDPKSDMLVVQYSMKWAEAAGLVKFDFLGLRTLTILQKCVQLLSSQGIEIDLSTLPEGDPKTYALMTRGDTLGVFQFESAGMISALKSLKPDAIEDLIALGALYRPGPMDNIPAYIEVKHGRQKPDYLHPLLEPVLRETYGVIIYQEQVQKIAQVLAGYTLGSADLLRRAMGKKIKAEMDAQRAQFVNGAKERGVDPQQASNIFELVAKFAGYGFNKSHAAAYAIIAYQTAYLKANYPVQFIAASMTFEAASTDKLSQFVGEAKKFNIAVLPPDINHSQVEFSVEKTEGDKLAIRYALAAIKNVGAGAMAAIVAEREANGAFKDIHDFARRVDASVMNRRQVEHLVMAGCFDSIHPNRRQLYESMDSIMGATNAATQERASTQVSLFSDAISSAQFNRCDLKKLDEWLMAERLNRECSAIGFYLSAHPLDPYQFLLKKLGVTDSQMLGQPLKDRQVLKLAGIVIANKVRTSPRGRWASTLFSDAVGQFEVAIFDENLLSRHHEDLQAGKTLLLHVDVRISERGQRLIISKIELLDVLAGQFRTQALTVKIDDISMLEPLKQTLGERRDRGARVELHIQVPGGMCKLKLAGAYTVAAPELLQLQAIRGIETVAA
jgi:DNA polymerase-3 subunit alpha